MDFLTGSNLLDFPESTLLNDILPKVPLSELNKFCLLSPQNNALCKRDELWIAKIEYEYPAFLNQKPTDISWSTYYVYLTRRRSIPVYVNGPVADRVFPAFQLPVVGGGPPLPVGLPNILHQAVALPPVVNVMFSSELFNFTLNDLLNSYTTPYYIIFTDDDDKPYILVREPDNVITTLSEKYDKITQVIISQS